MPAYASFIVLQFYIVNSNRCFLRVSQTCWLRTHSQTFAGGSFTCACLCAFGRKTLEAAEAAKLRIRVRTDAWRVIQFADPPPNPPPLSLTTSPFHTDRDSDAPSFSIPKRRLYHKREKTQFSLGESACRCAHSKHSKDEYLCRKITILKFREIDNIRGQR